MKKYRNPFAIAVNVNQSAGVYEGYIYRRWPSSASESLKGTFQGRFPEGTPLDIITGHNEYTFQIYNDIYVYNEQFNGFFIQTSSKSLAQSGLALRIAQITTNSAGTTIPKRRLQ